MSKNLFLRSVETMKTLKTLSLNVKSNTLVAKAICRNSFFEHALNTQIGENDWYKNSLLNYRTKS
jgi:hypothetical protein